MMPIFENPRRVRMRAGLTGKEMNEKIGMRLRTYRQVESSRRRLKSDLPFMNRRDFGMR